MANVERHPRSFEGAVRLSSLRICEANANGHDLLEQIDGALVFLRGLRERTGYPKAAFQGDRLVTVLIREYEDLRSRLTPLSSGIVPRSNEMDIVRQRLALAGELLECIAGWHDAREPGGAVRSAGASSGPQESGPAKGAMQR